jgi:hypothetical protein
MTIPTTSMDRAEKLERLQDRLEAAQDAQSGEDNPWLVVQAQQRTEALQRRVAALYKGG